MQKVRILSVIVISAMLFSACTHAQQQSLKSKTNKPETNMSRMKLKSKAFENNQQIPKRHTCDGENLSPPLSIEEIPDGTKSMAVIVEDPDAPVGIFTHWLVWNMPPQFDELPEGSPPPSSLQGINGFGDEKWGGPCPPPGPEHRYIFKIFALDTILELKKEVRKPLLEEAIEGHIIDQAELIGLYGRGR